MGRDTPKTVGEGIFFFFFGLMISPLSVGMWENYGDFSYTLLISLILPPAIAYSFYFRNLSKDLATLIPLFVLEIILVVEKGKTYNSPALDAHMKGNESASIMALGTLVCIFAATIGRYKAALLYLGLAVGVFLFRCFVGGYWIDTMIMN